MSNNRNDLRRFGIFKNRRGQNIYYDKRTKTAYIIQESDLKRFQLISGRMFLALALGILLYGFLNWNIYACMVVSIATYIGTEFYFRNILLASFPRTKNMDGIIIHNPSEIRMQQQDNTLWLKVAGYWLSSGALITVTVLSNYEIWQKLCIYALASYAIYNGVLNLLAIFNKKKVIAEK